MDLCTGCNSTRRGNGGIMGFYDQEDRLGTLWMGCKPVGVGDRVREMRKAGRYEVRENECAGNSEDDS